MTPPSTFLIAKPALRLRPRCPSPSARPISNFKYIPSSVLLWIHTLYFYFLFRPPASTLPLAFLFLTGWSIQSALVECPNVNSIPSVLINLFFSTLYVQCRVITSFATAVFFFGVLSSFFFSSPPPPRTLCY
jgi:hypothetical protein